MHNILSGAMPIYQQLFEKFRDEILAHHLKPGQRIDSITEMQKKYRVARDTAKRVLNLLEAHGLIVQQAGRGSFVADLRPVRPVWGVVYPFFSVQYEELVLMLTEHAQGYGRELFHHCDYNNYQEEMRLVGTMLNDRYEAIIVISTLDESKTLDFYTRMSPMGTRIILLDHMMFNHDFSFVVQSYDLGVVRALTYLMEQKGGGVAFVENEVWAGRNMVLELMRETYLDLMGRKRPGFGPLILPRARGVDAAAFRKRGITGIFCCDDFSAIQVIGRLKEQGMEVPRDYNLVSYGNTDIGRYFTPPVSSVDPRNAEMAGKVAAMLNPHAEGDAIELGQHIVHPELVVRGT